MTAVGELLAQRPRWELQRLKGTICPNAIYGFDYNIQYFLLLTEKEVIRQESTYGLDCTPDTPFF